MGTTRELKCFKNFPRESPRMDPDILSPLRGVADRLKSPDQYAANSYAPHYSAETLFCQTLKRTPFFYPSIFLPKKNIRVHSRYS